MMNYSAPGKLFISGEWSILEVGNIGLVAAVNNRVRVSLDESDEITISAEEFGIKDVKAKYENSRLVMDASEKDQKTLELLSSAISTSLKYLEEKNIQKKNFTISTSSKDTQFEVNGEVKKIGFGSSAAVVVTAVYAVLDFHGYKATQDEIYKLATVAHFYAQGKVGSAFDVAASTFGGLFVYSRFDPEWLKSKIDSAKLSDVISEDWPNLVTERVEVPDNFNLLVAWTGDSASTKEMVKQMNEFRSANKERYDALMSEIAYISKNAIDAFRKGDKENFLSLLQKNEKILTKLGSESGVNIETPELKTLSETASEHGAAGKLSGAGGGDCGIGVCFDDETAKKIIAAWREASLHPLDVTIDRRGVSKD